MCVVEIDHGSLWPRTEPAIEQPLLRVPVILHSLVIVEMVSREVGEDRNCVVQRVTTMKVHRLRRTLHHGSLATNAYRLAQEPLHVGRFRSCPVRLFSFFP